MAVIKVVILNWNGEEVLPRFLPSVVENTPPVVELREGGGEELRVEIVVADNGSSDSSVELLRRDFPTVRVLRLDRNYGFAEGYNRALALLEEGDKHEDGCGGECVDRCERGGGDEDFYVLLNSDVETPAGWLEPLVRVLSERADVAAVAPKLLACDERADVAAADVFAMSAGAEAEVAAVAKPRSDVVTARLDVAEGEPIVETEAAWFEYAGASGGFIDSLGYPFCRGRILGVVERDTGQYDDAREVFWATGACFVCRARVFRDLGGFDTSFFAHQEEIDLCWRMWLAGWKVMVEPRSAVFHLGAGTLAPSPRKLYFNYRNNLAMLYKNLSRRRVRIVLAIRYVLDWLSALMYLVRRQRDNFDAVRRAHRDFRAMKRGAEGTMGAATAGGSTGSGSSMWQADSDSLREKRRHIQAGRVASPEGIYRGSIVLRYLFGGRRFGKLL